MIVIVINLPYYVCYCYSDNLFVIMIISSSYFLNLFIARFNVIIAISQYTIC